MLPSAVMITYLLPIVWPPLFLFFTKKKSYKWFWSRTYYKDVRVLGTQLQIQHRLLRMFDCVHKSAHVCICSDHSDLRLNSTSAQRVSLTELPFSMSSHWIEDMYHIIKSVRVKRMGPMGLKQCLVVFYCLLSERQKTNKNLRSLSGELPCPGPAEEVELCQVDISLITFFVGINFILIIIIITILSSLCILPSLSRHQLIILGTRIYNAIYTRM